MENGSNSNLVTESVGLLLKALYIKTLRNIYEYLPINYCVVFLYHLCHRNRL